MKRLLLGMPGLLYIVSVDSQIKGQKSRDRDSGSWGRGSDPFFISRGSGEAL